MSSSIEIPENILKNWEITDWLSLKKTHIIFRAVHKQTEEIKIFQIISRHSFSKEVWESLSAIHSDYLLLPKRQKSMKNTYLLNYAPAAPLNTVIQADGMSVTMILQLLLDISKALQKLHQANILHMDISPGNIYLSEQGNFMLGDFSESISSKSTLKQTQYQTTPGYAAPEHIRGKPVEASDQYSLGILGYALVNDGLLPADLHSPPEPAIVQSDAKIGQEIFSVLRKSLSPEPYLRYESLSDFQEAIQTILSHYTDKSNYYLHITDKTHPFFQFETEQIASSPTVKQSGKTLMVPAFLLLLIFLLFTGIHLSDKKKQKTDSKIAAETIPTKTNNKALPETNPTKTENKTLAETNPDKKEGIETTFSTELDFADRDLSSLVEVIAECENPSLTQSIYGENNHLKSVEELQVFSSLQELYLSNNQIQNTDSFQELSNLSVLILSDNLCANLDGLSALQQLNFLDLSGNSELSDISPLANCRNLNTLILSDTAVNELSIQQLQAELPECQILY